MQRTFCNSTYPTQYVLAISKCRVDCERYSCILYFFLQVLLKIIILYASTFKNLRTYKNANRDRATLMTVSSSIIFIQKASQSALDASPA